MNFENTTLFIATISALVAFASFVIAGIALYFSQFYFNRKITIKKVIASARDQNNERVELTALQISNDSNKHISIKDINLNGKSLEMNYHDPGMGKTSQSIAGYEIDMFNTYDCLEISQGNYIRITYRPSKNEIVYSTGAKQYSNTEFASLKVKLTVEYNVLGRTSSTEIKTDLSPFI